MRKAFRAIACSTLFGCLMLPGAGKADWDVSGRVGETIEANDNPQLLEDSPGGSVGSLTGLSLQAINTMPTSSWELGTNLAFSKFWGPGALDSLDGVRGGVRTAYDKATPLTEYHAGFSAQVLPASLSEVVDSGLTNADSTSITYAGDGALKHQLNQLNAFALSISASSQAFIDDGQSPGSDNSSEALTPNTYVTAGQSWIHALSPRTDFTLALSTGWYTSDGGTDSLSESATAAFQTQFSERLSASIRAGGNVVRTTGNIDPETPGVAPSSDETSTGFIGSADLAYALRKRTNLGVSASHDLAPSSLGELQQRTAVGVTLGHQINERSSLSASGVFVNQLPLSSTEIDLDSRQALVLSLAYQRSLSQYWDLQLAYNFTEQNNGQGEFVQFFNDEGQSISNAVFLTLSRQFVLKRGRGEEPVAELDGAGVPLQPIEEWRSPPNQRHF